MCGSNCMSVCKRQNYIESKNVSGCQGFDEGMSKWIREGFWGSENTLCDTVMIDSYHFIFIKIHRVYNTNSESYCKLWPLGDYDVSM